MTRIKLDMADGDQGVPSQITEELGKVGKDVFGGLGQQVGDIVKGATGQPVPTPQDLVQMKEKEEKWRKEEMRRLRKRLREMTVRQTQFQRTRQMEDVVKKEEEKQKQVAQFERKKQEPPMIVQKQWVERRAGLGGG